MKKQIPKQHTVAGIAAPTPRPTPFGALVVATVFTLPLGIAVLLGEILF
ncbi:hypothetical protein [Yoonia sediminilitoris]|nr:hypothetical protein [Yoonia sediminilitoris]